MTGLVLGYLFDTLQLLQYNEHLAENAETVRGASV